MIEVHVHPSGRPPLERKEHQVVHDVNPRLAFPVAGTRQAYVLPLQNDLVVKTCLIKRGLWMDVNIELQGNTARIACHLMAIATNH